MEYIAHSETHAGMEIEVWQDQDTGSGGPHGDMDCLAPMLAVDGSTRGATPYGASDTGDFDPMDYASEVEIMLNVEKIIEIMDECRADVWDDIMISRDANHHPFAFPADFADVLKERWSNAESSPQYRRDLDKRAALFHLFNIPAHVETSRGYSQGDCSEVLCVHLPEWRAKVGTPEYDLTKEADREAVKKDMIGDIGTWSCWAWGNVYGFTVSDPDGEANDEHCGGFYTEPWGDDWEYLLSEARARAEEMAKDRALAIAA